MRSCSNAFLLLIGRSGPLMTTRSNCVPLRKSCLIWSNVSRLHWLSLAMMVCRGKRSRKRQPFMNDAPEALSTDATVQLSMSQNIYRCCLSRHRVCAMERHYRTCEEHGRTVSLCQSGKKGMPLIRLETAITAPVERCFDLSLSVDLHRHSVAHTHERPVAGVTSGMMKRGDSVTWEAVHFGIKQHLTSKISTYERPYHFTDEMVRGIFQEITHIHEF